MPKTITATHLRDQVGRVLDEVRHTGTNYIVKKLGRPFAVVISLEDYELLQAARRQAAEKEDPST